MFDEISVVIPLYNKEKHVARAIDSVLCNMTKWNGEVIVVNDGSKDSGGEIAKVYASKYPNIKVIDQPNQGVSVARNVGVQNAKNEYIAFLDADDEWLPGFLGSIRQLIKKYPDAVGYGSAYVNVYKGGKFVRPVFLYCPNEETGGIITDFFKSASYGYSPIWSSTLCLRKTAFVNAGEFIVGESHGEDKSLWARLALIGKFAWTPNVLALRYHDAESRSVHTWKAGREWSFFEIADKFINDGAVCNINIGSLRQYLGYHCLLLAKRHFVSRNNYDGIKYIVKSLILSRGKVLNSVLVKAAVKVGLKKG